MSTFIGQLFGFAVIILLVWRYVVPQVRKMMADRQEHRAPAVGGLRGRR